MTWALRLARWLLCVAPDAAVPPEVVATDPVVTKVAILPAKVGAAALAPAPAPAPEPAPAPAPAPRDTKAADLPPSAAGKATPSTFRARRAIALNSAIPAAVDPTAMPAFLAGESALRREKSTMCSNSHSYEEQGGRTKALNWQHELRMRRGPPA